MARRFTQLQRIKLEQQLTIPELFWSTYSVSKQGGLNCLFYQSWTPTQQNGD